MKFDMPFKEINPKISMLFVHYSTRKNTILVFLVYKKTFDVKTVGENLFTNGYLSINLSHSLSLSLSLNINIYIYIYIYITVPSYEGTRSIFHQSLTSLNSEFSFS